MTTPELPVLNNAEPYPDSSRSAEAVDPTPEIYGEALFKWLNKGWDRLDAAIQSGIPAALNPFGQLGAIANACLIIAVISGIAMLWWYTPSVHKAYSSLEAVRQLSWLGQLVRSIHRYSSDGCLFFILLHAFRITCQRRITGPRWLAWTTGLLLLALVSFIGWTGYWLVWDVRAQHAALGTARFIDSLPIFVEPLSRSFLTDATVPSLLFFLIFFTHMLAPLAVGVAIWMHLMRVNRAKFIPSRPLMIGIVISLIALSVLSPAISASPAQMTVKAPVFTIDWWYLWPFTLTDRLGGGGLWATFLLGGVGLLSAPWLLAKRKQAAKHKAEVQLSRCIGCSLCARDCPFNAITMIAREDGRKFNAQSHVDPDLCVGCGICSGACDSQAINLPVLNSRNVEQRTIQWIRSETAAGREPLVAFACGESGAASLREQPNGYLVHKVPCVGWVSAVLIERLVGAGAAGILVIGCGDTDPRFREGAKWFGARLSGAREPKVDFLKVDPWRIRFVKIGAGGSGEAEYKARTFKKGVAEPQLPKRQPIRKFLFTIILCSVVSGFVLLGSKLPYKTAHSSAPELIVSLNHSGALINARKLSAEELAKRLPHMRAQASVTRERAPVRLRLWIDGQIIAEQSFAPKGLSKDGPGIGSVRREISAGEHLVNVDIGDDAEQTQWAHQWSQKISFKTEEARVLLFDTKNGFSLH